MSSASPGYVTTGADPEGSTQSTANDARAIDARAGRQRAGTPPRAVTTKRTLDSLTATPSRAGAAAILGNVLDSVRSGAIRGLQALSDTIERGRDSLSDTSSIEPHSPTAALRAPFETPEGKRRRTARTEAATRSAHANWRAPQWDYSGAMQDGVFYRVADSGPSMFSLPHTVETRLAQGGQAPEAGMAAQPADAPVARPSSAMSAASAPAAFSTPSSHQPRGAGVNPVPSLESSPGWITARAEGFNEDVFTATLDGDMGAEVDDDMPDSTADMFVRAIEAATALMSADALHAPASCGAVHSFVSRLRVLDTQGNFTVQCPAGDATAAELSRLRESVSRLERSQETTAAAIRELAARKALPPSPRAAPQPDADETAAPSPSARDPADREHTQQPAQGAPRPPPRATPRSPAAPQSPPPSRTANAKGVGRHDERRAVFRPAKPFGGRTTGAASADTVRRLNTASYQIRDAINAALRDLAVAGMAEPAEAVQVVGVNWTERGNLCVVVCDGFLASHLLAHADRVAQAAGLGEGYSASRDVPIFKAVLNGVPTQRVDGALFTEADVLADLRAHSLAFRDLSLAETAEAARWISTANTRTLQDRSTILLSFATEGDASKFAAMHKQLFAFGCPCEPGAFQPRDKERVCTRCWNPLARHRERDFVCKEVCRLCGGPHAEEDHACTACDVLAKPCAHIGLKCCNCGLGHAANDSVCEYRRRTTGTARSAPPMASHANTTAGEKAAPKTKGRKARRVRVLDPHEPFPDDGEAPAPAPSQALQVAQEPPPSPTQQPALPHGETAPGATRDSSAPQRKGGRKPGRMKPATAPATASAPPPAPSAGQGAIELDAADMAVLHDLVGTTDLRDDLGSPPGPPQPATPGTGDGDGSRRVASSRIAASEAPKEARRRRVAHALVRAFRFLDHPAAVAALKARFDDYTTTVSWASEEQNKRNRPGMQGKSDTSLRRIVEEMKALEDADIPVQGNDTPSTTRNA